MKVNSNMGANKKKKKKKKRKTNKRIQENMTGTGRKDQMKMCSVSHLRVISV